MIEQTLEIICNRRINPHTFLMGFRSPEMVAAASPGQFVMVRVGSGMEPLLRRPFSICGIQGDDLLLILYRVVGKGTAVMAEKNKGETLSVLGPLGQGFPPPGPEKIPVLVGGGIGVAPLFFLAQAIGSRDTLLMTGFSSSSEVITAGQIGDLVAKVSIATDDGTEGYAGLVTDLLEEYIKRDVSEKDSISLFTCGPVPMLKKVVEMALDYQVSCYSSLEAAMACGLGACQGCAVKASSRETREYFHVCKDGPIFPVQAIDWKSV